MMVLTHDLDYAAPGCTVVHSLDESVIVAGPVPEIMVIGGASLYAQTLPLASQLYLTCIETDLPGDVWFPEWDPGDWTLKWEETHPADAEHAWPYRFQRWERLANAGAIALTRGDLLS